MDQPAVARQEGWHSGCYAYRAERRDEDGHPLEVLAHGQSVWSATPQA